MASVFNAPRFRDEKAAYAWVEARVWPDGPICPHCGSVDSATALQGKSTRIGVYKCRACRKPFTVKVGTIFEASHVPMHIWLQAIGLLTASKKGISSNQLHRTLGVTLVTAWFMSHRIREAMIDGSLAPLGGNGATVEADETYYGEVADETKRRRPGQRGPAGKRPVVGLIERGGKVRTFHVANADKVTVEKIVRENVDRQAAFMTDEFKLYPAVGVEFASHETVCHSAGEYVRDMVHTNTIDGYWSVFKRGMRGIYQHCGERHLQRYLTEFDFRYNARIALGVDDEARAEKAIKGIVGKRLTYRTTDQQMRG